MDVDTKDNIIYFKFVKEYTPEEMARIIGETLLEKYAYVDTRYNIDMARNETLVAFDIRRVQIGD